MDSEADIPAIEVALGVYEANSVSNGPIRFIIFTALAKAGGATEMHSSLANITIFFFTYPRNNKICFSYISVKNTS